MRAGSPSRTLAAAFSTALLLTVLLAAVPTTRSGFSATTENLSNSFVTQGWKDILALDGGIAHACLARADGSVWCWGLNDRGQLGDTTTTDRWAPVQVTGSGGSGLLTGAVALAAGAQFTCAARDTGEGWCWGANNNGQLGNNTGTDSSAPVQVLGPGGTGTLSGIVDVAGGLSHACAVKSDTTVWCWGLNDRGQLGVTTPIRSPVPMQVTGPGGTGTLSGVATVTAGAKFSCAVKTDTTVWCWGDNSNGQLGDTTTTARTSPVQVTGSGGTGTLTGMAETAAGESFVCAVKTDSTVWCWGRNHKVQLADASSIDRSSPVQVIGPGGTGTLTGAVLVGAGDLFSCAALDDDTVWCWGDNSNGQLGDNTTTGRTSPVQVMGGG